MRRAGNGESASIPFLIRVAGAEESKVDELSRLEFEAFGLRKIERRSAGTESFMSLQAYFVGWHGVLGPPFVPVRRRCAGPSGGGVRARWSSHLKLPEQEAFYSGVNVMPERSWGILDITDQLSRGQFTADIRREPGSVSSFIRLIRA